MNYLLSTLNVNGRTVAAVKYGHQFWDIAQLAPDLFAGQNEQGWIAAMDRWPEVDEALSVMVAERTKTVPPLEVNLTQDDILAPLLYPRKVVCTGANYREHLGEVGFSASFDKSVTRPSFFLKPPTTAITGSGKSVQYPAQSGQFDWEIEFAIVIGKQGRHIPVDSALEHVAGYTIGIDLSARDYLLHSGNITGFDPFGGKAFDHSCPLGPHILPARFMDDPQNLDLRLRVNGEVKQSSNTSQMIWSIAEQIAEISAILTLEPGDIILTGTPSGAGLKTGTFLKPGDRIEAEVEKVGTLVVEITDPHPAPVATPLTPSSPASQNA